MRISKRGQITIPKDLRDRFGMHPDAEVEITATEGGLLIRKRVKGQHPVDAIYGIANGWAAKEYGSTDEYMSDIRGYDYAAELRRYNDHRS